MKPKKNLKNVRSNGFTIGSIIPEESLAQHQLYTYKVCVGYLHLALRNGVLAIVIWLYYIGAALSQVGSLTF
jgi:hypothetical protein